MSRKSLLGNYEKDDKGGDYYPLHDFIESTHPNNNNINNNDDDGEGIEMIKDLHEDDNSLLEKSTNSAPAFHNLDTFLSDVYNYFQGKGFLLSFVDYAKVFGNSSTFKLSESVDFSRPIPIWIYVFLTLFSLFWLFKFFRFFLSLRTNLQIRSFYHNTLLISEDDLQTIEWREVVSRIVLVPRLCIVKENMNALDIANRIMRKENYFIGLINLKIFNLAIPLPFFSRFKFITKTLEWGIMYCIFNFVFDEHGIIKKEFLDPRQRQRLARGLSRRFITIGIIGLFTSPFIFFFLLINFFFQYAEEIKNRPGSLGSREWSPLARWKFREFNELPHYFKNRLGLSYVHAENYVNSFTSEFLSIVARFISFILGSFLAVLIVFGIYSDDFLMNYQIFDRSPIWYVGIFGTVVAICRSLINDENQVFQPAKHMARTIQFTHYFPKSWMGKSHTHTVRDEFLLLFEFRVVDFLREISSVIFTPFILIFSLPTSSFKILEFFGNTTVSLDGVGPICEFGAFTNIKRIGHHKYGATSSGDSKPTKQAKLEKSMINFKAINPDWKIEKNEFFDNLNQFAQDNVNNNNNNNNQPQPHQQQPTGKNNKTKNNLNGDSVDNVYEYMPPHTSMDNFSALLDSHYIPPDLINTVLGNESQSPPIGKVDQNIVNAVNNIQQSFYFSQMHGLPTLQLPGLGQTTSSSNSYQMSSLLNHNPQNTHTLSSISNTFPNSFSSSLSHPNSLSNHQNSLSHPNPLSNASLPNPLSNSSLPNPHSTLPNGASSPGGSGGAGDKRSRGRPRKNPPAEPKDPSSPKRKRGRPPKLDKDGNPQPKALPTPSNGSKKRGRPKKLKDSTDDSSGDFNGNGFSDDTPKKRGRPPKSSKTSENQSPQKSPQSSHTTPHSLTPNHNNNNNSNNNMNRNLLNPTNVNEPHKNYNNNNSEGSLDFQPNFSFFH
eukprot:gene5254-6537_t